MNEILRWIKVATVLLFGILLMNALLIVAFITI